MNELEKTQEIHLIGRCNYEQGNKLNFEIRNTWKFHKLKSKNYKT